MASLASGTGKGKETIPVLCLNDVICCPLSENSCIMKTLHHGKLSQCQISTTFSIWNFILNKKFKQSHCFPNFSLKLLIQSNFYMECINPYKCHIVLKIFIDIKNHTIKYLFLLILFLYLFLFCIKFTFINIFLFHIFFILIKKC